jgi:hypothetical protein
MLPSQCRIDHQNYSVPLIFGTPSVGGCGGHPIRPKLNLNNKGQMSKPDEYTYAFKLNLNRIFLSVKLEKSRIFVTVTIASSCKKWRSPDQQVILTHPPASFRVKSSPDEF